MNRLRKFLYLIICAGILIYYFISVKYNLFTGKGIISNFSTIFTSIVLEAIPFILIGSLISAVIQIYISEESITRWIHEDSILSYVGAALAGFIFPICECAIIPITRGFIRKGLPVGIGITFMLAVPIINPVVILSTYYAFHDNLSMVIVRTGCGFACAIIIGLLVNIFSKNKDVLKSNINEEEYLCSCGCMDINMELNKFRTLIEHTNREFLDIMRYLIFGALISSVFQTMRSQGYFEFIGDNIFIQIIFMMTLSFILSLCSEVDAFVAKSFLNQCTFSSIAGFLLLGPMLDFKNLVMLYGTFNSRFVAKLCTAIISVILVVCLILMITEIGFA